MGIVEGALISYRREFFELRKLLQEGRGKSYQAFRQLCLQAFNFSGS